MNFQVGDHVCQRSCRGRAGSLRARPAALGVEVPLVPGRAAPPRRGRPRRREGVLNRVTADQHRRAHAIGVERRGDAAARPPQS